MSNLGRARQRADRPRSLGDLAADLIGAPRRDPNWYKRTMLAMKALSKLSPGIFELEYDTHGAWYRLLRPWEEVRDAVCTHVALVDDGDESLFAGIMNGEALDHFADDQFAMPRKPGETDSELRARLMSYVRNRRGFSR